MRAPGGIVALLFLVACGRNADQVPIPDDIQTLVLAFDDDGTPPRIEVTRVDDSVNIELDSFTSLFGIGYEADLETLNLVEGPQSLDLCGRSCGLTHPDMVLHISEDNTEMVSIESADHLIDRLVPDREARCEECASYARHEVQFSTETFLTIQTAMALPEGRAAFTTRSKIFVVEPDHSTRVLCTTSTTYNEGAQAGGQLWLSNSHHVHHIDIDAQDGGPCLTLTATIASDVPIRDIDAKTGVDGQQHVFMVTDSGRLWEYRDSRFEPVGQTSSEKLRLVAGPGGDVYAATASGRFFYWSGQELTEIDNEQIPKRIEVDGGTYLGGELGFGFPYHDTRLLVGGLGVLLSRGPQDWTAFDYTGTYETQTVFPAPPGLIACQRGGGLQRLNPTTGVSCPAEPGFYTDTPHKLIRLGTDEILVPDISENENRPGIVGILSPPRAECR